MHELTAVRRVMYPGDLDLWPWRLWRVWLMQTLWVIHVPSLKFIGLSVWKILDIYCVNISRPGGLNWFPRGRHLTLICTQMAVLAIVRRCVFAVKTDLNWPNDCAGLTVKVKSNCTISPFRLFTAHLLHKAFLFTTVYWLRICGLGEFSALQMSLLLLL